MATQHSLAKQLTKTGVVSYLCEVCGQSFKYEPTSASCPGVKVWRWDDWTRHGLLTKKQLYDAGYSTGKTKLPKPSGAVRREKSPDGWMWLYSPADGVIRKEADEATKARLDAARQKFLEGWTCKRCGYRVERYKDQICNDCERWLQIEGDHDAAIEWAKEVLADPMALILDSETCDLGAEIIELAIINMQGETLFNKRFKPVLEIADGASAVHGMTTEILADEPDFAQYDNPLRFLLGNASKVIIYNRSFDVGCLNVTCNLHEIKPFEFKSECAMLMYAQWIGDWSNYWGNYKWYPLSGGDHSALGDCLATLECLKEMARNNAEIEASAQGDNGYLKP